MRAHLTKCIFNEKNNVIVSSTTLDQTVSRSLRNAINNNETSISIQKK